jgi:hypothetical protein
MDTRTLPIRAQAPAHPTGRDYDARHRPTLDDSVKEDRLSDDGTPHEQEQDEQPEDEEVEISVIKAFLNGEILPSNDLERIGKELAVFHHLNAVPSVVSADNGVSARTHLIHHHSLFSKRWASTAATWALLLHPPFVLLGLLSCINTPRPRFCKRH